MGICFGRSAEVVHPLYPSPAINDVPLISQQVKLASCIESLQGCRIKVRIPATQLAQIFSQGKSKDEALASFIVESIEAKCSFLTFQKPSFSTASWRPSLESIREEQH